MRFVADLHIHSKHSRACSKDCDLEHLAWWAGHKGIAVVGTGDFTHPGWVEELRGKLRPAEPGLFRLQPEVEQGIWDRLPPACRTPVRFMLSSEISTIYKRDDRTRKVHHLLYAADFEAVDRITTRLARIGNLTADGRPILGLDSRDLLEITLESGDDSYLVPAHAWTPWFAVLGSQSGFDAVDDCYADLAEHVFAVETGLSSDPEMNWRVSSLDRFRLVSNSDAHSPPMLGREATVFDTDVDYFAMLAALRTGDGFAGTVEFFPEEGKYHLDGHRNCGVRTDPEETRALGGRCPTCTKPLTVGVLHRVDALADRPADFRPTDPGEFRSLVPLPEIVGEILGKGPKTKTVTSKVSDLVGRLGPELTILNDVPLDDVARVGSPVLVEALDRLRRGQVVREGGFDGEYGTIRLFTADELAAPEGSQTLFAVPGPASAALGRRQPKLPEPVDVPRPPALAREPGTDARGAAAPATPGPAAAATRPAAPRRTDPAEAVLDGLDADQRAVVCAGTGPTLVVAGPGTGKTRVLSRRLAYRVVAGAVPPDRCLALTFTRRAATELEGRLRQVAPGATDRITVATFHRLGLQLLREHGGVLGVEPSVRVVAESSRLALLAELGGGPAAAARLAVQVGEAKRGGTDDDTLDDPLPDLVRRYDDALRRGGLVDFDDLQVLPIRLLDADPSLADRLRDRWSEVCVDEYQDVDGLQYRLLRLLTRPDGNLCAIGDPDQAIYGFRGGDVGYFLRFRQDFPTVRVVELTRSYRSTPTVVRASLQAVAPGTLVPDRVLAAARTDGDGDPVVVHRAADPQEEAEVVARSVERLLGGSSLLALDRGAADGSTRPRLSFADVAVLYRMRAQAAVLAEALDRRGFPVQVRSHERLVDRPGVRAVLAVLDPVPGAAGGTVGTGTVADRLTAAVRTITAGGSSTTEGSADPDGVPRAEVLVAGELLAPLAVSCGSDLERFLTELELGLEVDTWDPRADRISLLTIHAAKGLEFPVVFVAGCEDGLLPYRPSPSKAPSGQSDTAGLGLGPQAAEEEGVGAPSGRSDAEERRLLFVGMTRAVDRLVLTSAARRHRWGRMGDTEPSPFLADIDPDLVEARTGIGDGPRRRPANRQLRLL